MQIQSHVLTNNLDVMESLPFGQQDPCIVTDEQQYITNILGRTLGEHQDMIQIRDKKWEELSCNNEGRCNTFRFCSEWQDLHSWRHKDNLPIMISTVSVKYTILLPISGS